MDKGIETKLMKLAKGTAARIRKSSHISGWHLDESTFPECRYADILLMLEKAYSLGENSERKKSIGKYKASASAIIGQAESSGSPERVTMETLLDIFDPEELVKMGYANMVKSYLDECGAGDEPADKTKTEHKGLWLCEHCIQAIRSREPLHVGPMALAAEESAEEGVVCDWCGEVDDLYECV